MPTRGANWWAMDMSHTTHVRVSSAHQAADVLARVNYARTVCV